MTTTPKHLCNSSQCETTQATVTPHYSVKKSEEAYTVIVNLSGVAKENAGVSVENNLLTIKAEKTVVQNDPWKVRHQEINPASYQLTLQVTNQVDQANIQAKFIHGRLVLNLPFTPKAPAIEIQVGE